MPVRFIAEALGYDVDWIQETKTVTINNGQILLLIGSNTATVNGAKLRSMFRQLIVTDGMTHLCAAPLRA